jgi:signal transduction histidine kinase
VSAASPPVLASLELPRRVERAFRALAYIALTIPLGALGLLALAGVAIGALLALVGLLPPLTLAIAAANRLAELDRRAANRLLDAHISPLRPGPRVAGSAWRRARAALADRQLWRVLALLALKLPVGAALLIAAVLPIALTAGLLSLGAQGIGGYGETTFVGPWQLGVASGILLCLLALPAAVLAIAILEGLGRALSALVEALLHSPHAAGGPVREMLAESLGDRTLSIAYWLPDRNTFVDEAGRPVDLPDPGSGRAWTAVERNGVRVAAIVHDAALDTGPELVQAAAAAAALALDNERLKADLRARVEELRVSRVRIVQAGDAARRRLERDLHDGAQQQLVALALDLRLLKARVRGTDAEPMVDGLAEKLAVALADLRELARGIHPAILTDRGLGPAIEALASRIPVAVESEVDVHERLSAPIEAAAYFVVAEALTNIVKYANATSARVTVRRAAEVVTVEVDDNGVGGARIGAGSGLRGLQDRLAALDGTLSIDSPRGGGTRLRARIPCGADALVAEARDPAVAAPPGPLGSPGNAAADTDTDTDTDTEADADGGAGEPPPVPAERRT